jgi:PhnB protein
MQSRLNPYLNFDGNTREVMEFYHSVFGGKLTFSTYKDYGASQDPTDDNRIMHSQLEAENGITLMAADIMLMRDMELHIGNAVAMSLSGDNQAELSGYFDKLAAGGAVQHPLTPAPWGDAFGSLIDKYGIEWLVNITAPRG